MWENQLEINLSESGTLVSGYEKIKAIVNG